MMSQRSILSFFKSSGSGQTNIKEIESKIIADDSPIKIARNKRKVQSIESGDDDESLDVSIKTELDAPNPGNKFIENNDETSANSDGQFEEENCESSSNQNVQNGFVNPIPKRKTARKQIQSSKKESSDAQLEKKSTSEMYNEINSNSKPSSTKNTSLEIEKMDSEITLENNSLTSEDIKEAKNKASTSKNDKGSPLKKCAKKESLHSFFTPLKNAKNKDNIEDKDKAGDDDKTEYKVNTEDKGKIEDKDKTEDKNKTEDKDKAEDKDKTSLEMNGDSPVKKLQKRKVQCLESSDDDDDGNASKVIKKEEAEEVTNIEDNSLLLQKTKVVKSENLDPDVNKTPSNKTVSEDSKSGIKKQTLGLKSTSAGIVYDPSKSNYHPIEDACWKLNEKVPYFALAKTLELIETTPGRLKTIEILSNYFRSVIVLSPDDLLHSLYLCLNRVAPEYEGIEMGVGETLLMKAVAQATGRTVDKIKAEVAIKGDLGLVSESSRGNQRVMFAPPKLTIASVFNKFLEIAKMSGNSAMAKKIDKIKGLFIACRDCEAKYIIRSLSGKLRIGLAEQSILCAISRAAVLTPPEQKYPPKTIDASKGRSSEKFKEFLDSQTLILKTAYCECPNYDLIIPVLLKNGISALPDHCQLSPGVPLKPMLAHPTDGIDRVLERFDKNAFTCEFKYDGERAQIHRNDKGEVKVFSRNQEDNTSKYPDIISRISKTLKESTKSFVLDSEAVAWDTKTKHILPFQVLSTRKRKDAVESEIVVQVCVMAFDLLYLNGESLVKKPLKERRSLMHSSFVEVENQFMFAQFRDGNSAETMQEFLDESVKGNCEGLMVKSLEVDASYEIAKRSRNWLKLKKDYLQGIGDTLDLVVIGGYYGKGKRTGNYGGFLLACYDEDNEEFQSICKLGTGFKDENLEAHTSFLKKHIIKEPKSYYRYDNSLEPDVWFEAVQVWEIKCADLSISPVHKAATGIVDPEKGISLRFPRFVRIRDDKTPENTTNSVQIADMYQRQQQIQNTANRNAKVEEDYY